MSGLENSTVQAKTLKKVINPAYGAYALNTIFDFDIINYPLLNLSSSAILQYAGGNLASTFDDRTWVIGKNIFSVSTKVLSDYRYILVTAVPLEDYLGDTINLADNLRASGVRSMIVVIVSAVVVVLSLSTMAVLFAWIFITRPLNEILDTIKKATKFDFSGLRGGKVNTRMSIVKEVHTLQNDFLKMVTVFAEAIKRELWRPLLKIHTELRR
ncbi:hypothetical protein M427DRAFT_365310 [Gonapodya prolifera JEL478]|uniref:HAMP domain-containing protein n=1 Tax=Gonapodya prolifera (strain JEL478) TaxID=1344416 RepID=A0A139A9V0_GONPJ|nr:hypothetical protein M427DRAFT_365310 [Gonapodya prolifera JEL478]|eukprot:KXS13622.1 hypothetical protein M427DRAFT_365310 [Gonapodya prolifera JEL478]